MIVVAVSIIAIHTTEVMIVGTTVFTQAISKSKIKVEPVAITTSDIDATVDKEVYYR